MSSRATSVSNQAHGVQRGSPDRSSGLTNEEIGRRFLIPARTAKHHLRVYLAPGITGRHRLWQRLAVD